MAQKLVQLHSAKQLAYYWAKTMEKMMWKGQTAWGLCRAEASHNRG
jgi:hypothetical protein